MNKLILWNFFYANKSYSGGIHPVCVVGDIMTDNNTLLKHGVSRILFKIIYQKDYEITNCSHFSLIFIIPPLCNDDTNTCFQITAT